MDNLEVVVEELMKEQHKDMMRRLKSGEFDDKAFSFKAQLIENYEIPTLAPEADPLAALFSLTPTAASAASKNVASLPFDLSSPPAKKDASPLKNSTPSDESKNVVKLDEAILSFFGPQKK